MNKTVTKQRSYLFIVGIDVSKESLDACMIEVASQEQTFITLGNTSEGYQKLKRWMKQHGNTEHE